MIFVTVRIMLPVFDPLILFFQFNLFIGNTVLIYIIFFFDLGLGGSLCQSFFVFLFNLCKSLLMLLQCLFLFRYTTCLNCIIIFVKIIFEIIFCFPDQFCDLVFVLCFYRFCLFKLLLAGCNLRIFFPFGKCFISFYVFDHALVHDYFCRTIFSEFINLFLYFSDIFLNRLTQCFFLLRCKNLAICHICPPCL